MGLSVLDIAELPRPGRRNWERMFLLSYMLVCIGHRVPLFFEQGYHSRVRKFGVVINYVGYVAQLRSEAVHAISRCLSTYLNPILLTTRKILLANLSNCFISDRHDEATLVGKEDADAVTIDY
jgi:hypothetical protein